MMRILLLAFVTSLCLLSPSYGASVYFEDFEDGAGGWQVWPGATDQLNLDSSHNHTPGGDTSYRASVGEPGGFASYTQIADGTGPVFLDVWAYVDNADPDLDNARGMIQLTSGVGFGTDYLQLGWLSDYAGGSERYSVRTKYRDDNGLGTFDTGIARPEVNDWVKLSIHADGGTGSDVRFYINDVLAYSGAGERLGESLDTIRLGVNFGNNYDTVWYDDVSVNVVPEPSSVALIALAAIGTTVFGLRRRRDVVDKQVG